MLVLAALLLMAAAASDADPPDAVVIAVGPEPGTLNWLVTTGGTNTSRDWVRPAFDPLAERNAAGQLEPVLLQQVPTVANGGLRPTAGGGLHALLRLHPDARWSDGTPVTCADVAFTWRTIMSDRWPTSPRGGWDRVRSVQCPSPDVAVVRFDTGGSFVELVLTSLPLPAHHLSGRDFRLVMRDGIDVHSGPYRLVRWQRGVGVVYERDPNYWRRSAAPAVDRLELRATAGGGSADLLVATGRVDVAARRLTGTIDDERHAFGESLRLLPPRSVVALAFNHGRPATADLRLRRAVLAAVDRSQVARAGLGTTAEPAAALAIGVDLPATAWEASEKPDSAARQGQLVLVVPAGNAPLERAAQVLHAQLADAGFRVQLRAQAPELYFGQTMPKGAWDLMLVEVTTSAEHGIRAAVACEPTPGRSNFMRLCDPEVDRLQAVRDARLDPTARARVDGPLHRLLAQRVVAIPLFEPRAAWISGGRVSGIEPASEGWLVRGFERWRVAE